MKSRIKFTFNFLSSLFFFFTFIQAFSSKAQSPPCTTHEFVTSIDCDPTLHSMDEKGPFFINIHVHAIRKDDGSGGQSATDIEEALGFLDAAFNEHNIFFVWDCMIHDVNSSSFYNIHNPGKDFFSDPVANPISGGINIYLFPDHPFPLAQGTGLASGIPGTALLVTGNNPFSPYGSRVKSHVLSHEMGHCLGLIHTHGDPSPDFPPQEPIGADCTIAQTTGDCVCDTPADPNIQGEVSFPNCEYTGNSQQGGIPYDPDEKNIMSYTHDECYEYFTPGQGKRMRNMIAITPELQAVLATRAINSTTTWDLTNTPSGIVEIGGTLEIEPGATLTIESGITVRFGRQSKLIIKPNARLVLHGTLTNNPCSLTCTSTGYCGDTWKGVEVWGGSASSSQIPVGGQYAQGRFQGKPGSLVENAEIAVQLYGPSLQQSGGIINCNGTTFKNNILGIDFFRYANFIPLNFPPPIGGSPRNYAGSFIDCSFVNDSGFPHQSNFRAFVNMFDVMGPRFIGCSFVSNYTPVSIDNIGSYGYGIHAIEAGFFVRGLCGNTPNSPCAHSSFQGLGYGIFTGGGFGANAPFVVSQADFSGCFVGILNRGVSGGTIVLNKFDLGNPPTTSLTSDQIGIALNFQIFGMTVEENDFVQVSGSTGIRTIGITSFGIGEFNQKIRRNSFNGLNIGNEAGSNCGGIESGLIYECNFNTNNTEYDFLICNGAAGNNRINGQQKSSDPNDNSITWSVGNRFSNTGTPNDRDFANEGGFELDYYHKTGGGILEIPDEYSGITSLIDAPTNTCPANYCDPPCKTKAQLVVMKNEFYNERVNYASAMSSYQSALTAGDTVLADQFLDTAFVHKSKKDENAYLILLHAMLDTTEWDRDTIRTWLENMDNYGAEMTLAADYLHEGDSTSAFAILDNAPTKLTLTSAQVADLNQVHALFTILYGQPIYALEDSLLTLVRNIAVAHGEYASSLAKNIMDLNGEHFAEENCIHDTRSYYSLDDKNDVEDIDIPFFKVYPNPASEEVTIEISNQIENGGTLVLKDITGKLIWHRKFEKGQILTFSDRRISAGIYLLSMVQNGQTVLTEKLVIQK